MTDLRQMLTGFQVSQALYAAVTLGLPDLLAAGPQPSDALARDAGADPDAVYRLLRALARAGVVAEQEGRVFTLTELGGGLRTGVDGSLHALAAHVGRAYHWNAWAELVESVRTGEAAFPRLHGRSAWEYREDHPEDGAIFDAWMTEQTRSVDAAIVGGYDFGRFSHVVDVGGGQGAFLRAIRAAHPSVRVTLFDQEHVLVGVDEIATVTGSFFDAVPPGGDAYVLKSIIHDWSDEDAIAILRTCGAALTDGARVLLFERDLEHDAVAPWMDLQMLVMLGGRERTAAEYRALFEAAGLRYLGTSAVGAGFAVHEATTMPRSA